MYRWLGEKWWRVPVLLVLSAVCFYWKVLLTNRSVFPWDAGDFFYPTLGFVHEELRHFRLPLWNPYNMSGFPAIADPESQIFYPPTWLLVLIDPFWHLPFKLVEVELVVHFILAGVFMYWLAKDYTKDAFSALLGGMLFMYSGAMVAHTEHIASIEAMAWYPLVFLLARRGLIEKSWRLTVAAGFFLGIENLAGHWQHAVYLGLLLFLYFLYEACLGPHRRELWPQWTTQLAAIGAIGAGLAMVQIVSSGELRSLSVRSLLSYWDITEGNTPQYLLTSILPNFWGGLNRVPFRGSADPSFSYVFLTVPGVALALVGLIEMGRRRNFFWLGSIVLWIELSFGYHGYLAGVVYRTPFLNLFRTMTTFIDLANFSMCLMAAIGVHALMEPASRGFYKRWLPQALLALLALAAALGVIYGLGWKISGWYHALAVLALFSVLITIWTKERIAPAAMCTAILALIAFDLCFYSMNQVFNRAGENPRTNLSYDYARGTRLSLEFLRKDAGGDFRVAAFDGSPWNSNGCDVWRIPCIFGWNPLMLRSYREYVRQFVHASNYALPEGETGHRLDSPLMDMLGVKYVLAIDPLVQAQNLNESSKFKKVFAEPVWRTIYRNDGYVPRAWFYSRAYVLPGPRQALALMNSSWFQPRNTLIFSQLDLAQADIAPSDPSAETLGRAVPLPSVALGPDEITASSDGAAAVEPNCPEARRFFSDWAEKNGWIQFTETNPPEPGRYAVLVEYTDWYEHAARVQATITQEGSTASLIPSDAVELPDTMGWKCSETGTMELGQANLSQAPFVLRLISEASAPVHIYSIWLVRLPDARSAGAAPSPQLPPAELEDGVPSRASNFLLNAFSISENRISFHADLPQDGFVLVNGLFYPGWEATVDGRPSAILKADYMFRALGVPAGSHEIEMEFRPRRFWFGALISLATLAGLLFYFARHRWPARFE